jgi:DNA-binding PadR family transcriptional regulator
MAYEAGDTISFIESKVIHIAKAQYDHGIHGGTFTPGYVRKETGYEYRAIDPALDSLVTHNLLEKSRTETFRNGAPVEIFLFRITEKGLQTYTKLKAGIINVEREPSARPFESHPSRDSHGSERGNQRGGQTHSSEHHLSLKRLEASLGEASAKLSKLHDKLDGMLGTIPAKPAPQQAIASEPAEALKAGEGPKVTKPPKADEMPHKSSRSTGKRATSPEKLRHQVLVVEALRELQKTGKGVLSSDIERMYGQRCKELGLRPKSHQQFALLLKRMAANGHLSLKLTGCRELGIKGHGSRLVVDLTTDGEEFLAKNGNPEGTVAASTGQGKKPHGKVDNLPAPIQTASVEVPNADMRPETTEPLKAAERPKATGRPKAGRALKIDEKTGQPKARRHITPSASFVLRHVLLLESVRELSKNKKYVLADEVKSLFIRKCEEKGATSRGIGQFGIFLKRFKADGLLTVKRMGCKAIGIDGRAARLVIEMTPEGEEYLAKNGMT